MAELILVTGGSRSGKSRHAQELAEGLVGRRTFVATCPRLDEEMDARIERHRKDREGKGWKTVEEQSDLAGLLEDLEEEVVLVDCLTLWVNNLIFAAEQRGEEIGEEEVSARARKLLDVCRERAGTVILVTNEVGLGIVPENRLARLFRDLVGRCNQVVAAGVDRMILMVSGLPVVIR